MYSLLPFCLKLLFALSSIISELVFIKLLSNYFVYSLLASFYYFELLFALSSIISELVFIKLLSESGEVNLEPIIIGDENLEQNYVNYIKINNF